MCAQNVSLWVKECTCTDLYNSLVVYFYLINPTAHRPLIPCVPLEVLYSKSFYTHSKQCLTSQIIKKIQKILKNAIEIKFWKKIRKSWKFSVITKMSAIWPKFNILSSSFFFAIILISIIIFDSTKKNTSWG